MIGSLHPIVDPSFMCSHWASHKSPVDVDAGFEQMTRRGGGHTSTWHSTAESRGGQFLCLLATSTGT
jgi:hypothetical protein